MTPERLAQIRELVESGNGTPDMSVELLALVAELEDEAKQWGASVLEQHRLGRERYEAACREAIANLQDLTKAKLVIHSAESHAARILEHASRWTVAEFRNEMRDLVEFLRRTR